MIRLNDNLLNFQRFNRVRLNEDLQRMELDNVVFKEFRQDLIMNMQKLLTKYITNIKFI